jgi:hypothetical protein
MKFTVDTEEIANLVINADKIHYSQEGEIYLENLLKLKLLIEQAEIDAKERVEETAKKLNPNFNSIESDKIKVTYRMYGVRYKLDNIFIEQLPKEVYKTETKIYPVAEEIDKLIEKTGGKIPQGIIEVQRVKQLHFDLKGK